MSTPVRSSLAPAAAIGDFLAGSGSGASSGSGSVSGSARASARPTAGAGTVRVLVARRRRA